MNLLGISIGATTYGIALIKNHTLEDWQLKTVHGKWSKLKLRTILRTIEQYCQFHAVTDIALKVPDPLKSSRDVDLLIKGVVKLAEKNHIHIYQYNISELKKHFLKRNKKGLMEYAGFCYPEVQKTLQRQRQTKNSYYIKLFEAICVAMYCMQKET